MDIYHACAVYVNFVSPHISFIARAIVSESLLKQLVFCDVTRTFSISRGGRAVATKIGNDVRFLKSIECSSFVKAELCLYEAACNEIELLSFGHMPDIPADFRIGCVLHALTLAGRASDASLAIEYKTPTKEYRKTLTMICWRLLCTDSERFPQIRRSCSKSLAQDSLSWTD